MIFSKNILHWFFLGAAFFVALFLINNLKERQEEFYATLVFQLDFPRIQNIHPKQIVLMFAGDIMLDRGVEYMVKKNGEGDYTWIFSKISRLLSEADILFGNLESVVSDKGVKVGTIYSFRADPEALESLVFAGFDVLSVANNHVFDFTRRAFEDSLLRIKDSGIDYVGGGFSKKEAHKLLIKEAGGVKIGFLAYNQIGSRFWEAKEKDSGIAWLDENIVRDVELAKELCDLLVVSMHFGEEYSTKESWQQQNIARQAIDSGADLVIGHHPHVVQPVEQYKHGYIAYSLGNFVFDQYFSKETMQGLLLKVLIEQGEIIKVEEINIEMNDFYQPGLIEE